MSKKLALFALAGGLVLFAAACAGTPKDVPPDLSSQELVQRAQEASDSYKYDVATLYYRALIDRFGTEPAASATGQYEIAFIQYKQGKLDEAKAGFEKLLALYAGPDGDKYPPAFKILSEKIMEEIKAKQPSQG